MTILTVSDLMVPPFASVPVPDDELPYMATVSVVDLPFESLTVADVVLVPELSTFFDVLY